MSRCNIDNLMINLELWKNIEITEVTIPKYVYALTVIRTEFISRAWLLCELGFNVFLGISRDSLWAMKISYIKRYSTHTYEYSELEISC